MSWPILIGPPELGKNYLKYCLGTREFKLKYTFEKEKNQKISTRSKLKIQHKPERRRLEFNIT